MKVTNEQYQMILNEINRLVLRSQYIPMSFQMDFIQIEFEKQLEELSRVEENISDLEAHVISQTQKRIAAFRDFLQGDRLPDQPKSKDMKSSRAKELTAIKKVEVRGQQIRRERIERYSHKKSVSR